MDKDNRTDPAVREDLIFDNMMTIATQLADLIPSPESKDDELDHTTHVMKTKETLPRLERRMESIVAACDNKEFKFQFRISRSTFEYILNIITPRLKSNQPTVTPPNKQLLITLWYMVTSDSSSSIGNRFSIDKKTVLDSVNRVVIALYNLKSSIITWPSGCNINKIWEGFKAISGFPNAIGVVGSTHLTFLPLRPKVLYENHKKKRSIQLQAVCDHNARFIHCFVYSESALCQEVFELSKLQKWLGNLRKFPANCYILGDATYKLHENVIVPYHDNGHLTFKRKNFNLCHSAARVAVKKAFGLLKTRFCKMRDIKNKKVDLIKMIVTVCCMIHNICLSEGDRIDYDFIDEAVENNPFHDDTASPQQAHVKRDSICAMLPMCSI